MNNYVVAITTTPQEKAFTIANALVESGYCACVNIISNVQSVYHWQGKIETENESILLIKTEEEFIDHVEERLKALHPYEVPEFIVLPIVWGSREYLDWISEGVRLSK